MKRLLVLSDTHGATGRIDLAIIKAGRTDGVIHLGDYVRDAEYIRRKGLEVWNVRGNCDIEGGAETELTLHLGGCRLLLTHGHRLGVKYSLQRVFLRAQEMEAQAVLFGHTHTPLNTYEGGILLLNPGSLAEPRNGKATFALLEAEDGTLRASLKTL